MNRKTIINDLMAIGISESDALKVYGAGYRRLQEKAEEPPCRVGDKLYFPQYCEHTGIRFIAELMVVKITSTGIFYTSQGKDINKIDNYIFKDSLGKQIFRDREAAAFKLAIMILESSLREKLYN